MKKCCLANFFKLFTLFLSLLYLDQLQTYFDYMFKHLRVILKLFPTCRFVSGVVLFCSMEKIDISHYKHLSHKMYLLSIIGWFLTWVSHPNIQHIKIMSNLSVTSLSSGLLSTTWQSFDSCRHWTGRQFYQKQTCRNER